MDFFKQNIIPWEVFVQVIAFVVVFLTLKALAWKPILAGLESRRSRIQNEFEKIESAKKEIEALKIQYSSQLQKIEDEARAKMLEAVDEGRRISREIQEKARTESQAAFEKAKENITIEVAKAHVSLRREIADLAVAVSEKVIREKMQGQAQQDKIMEIIEDLEKSR